MKQCKINRKPRFRFIFPYNSKIPSEPQRGEGGILRFLMGAASVYPPGTIISTSALDLIDILNNRLG